MNNIGLQWLKRAFQRPMGARKAAPSGGRSQAFAGGWKGAGHGRRLTDGQDSGVGIHSRWHTDLDTLRQRSRDLVRNNPYAANLVDSWVSNLIGTGIKAQPKTEDAVFRQALQSVWSQWVNEADSDGMSDFNGLQARVCRSVIEGGECLVRFQVRPPANAQNDMAVKTPFTPVSVPLQLQVLEAEHLDSSQDRPLSNGGVIQGGIECNAENQRVAYHLHRSHPGEARSAYGRAVASGLASVRVPASQILHLYRMDRPGQMRGRPWLSPVLLKLQELDQYDEAELARKKVAAIFAGFITRLDPESSFFGEGEANAQGTAFAGLEPGTLQCLDPGEDIKFSEPSDVGGNYLDFMRQQLRAIAAGVGLTYEQLTGDLTQVNYSSIRAGLIEFRRRCRRLQHQLMVFQFCRPVWQRWLEVALVSQALTLPKNARDYHAVQWVPQGFDGVDPLKDQRAQQVAVRNGFKTRAQVVSESGYDVETLDQEAYRDHERAEALNLPFDSHVRQANHPSPDQGEDVDEAAAVVSAGGTSDD